METLSQKSKSHGVFPVEEELTAIVVAPGEAADTGISQKKEGRLRDKKNCRQRGGQVQDGEKQTNKQTTYPQFQKILWEYKERMQSQM